MASNFSASRPSKATLKPLVGWGQHSTSLESSRCTHMPPLKQAHLQGSFLPFHFRSSLNLFVILTIPFEDFFSGLFLGGHQLWSHLDQEQQVPPAAHQMWFLKVLAWRSRSCLLISDSSRMGDLLLWDFVGTLSSRPPWPFMAPNPACFLP